MITIYGKPSCPYCVQAKGLLDAKSIPYEYVDITQDEVAREKLVSSGFRTVPQCYDGERHIGGFTDLQQYVIHVRIP